MKFYSSFHSKIFVDVCIVAERWVHISDKPFLVYEWDNFPKIDSNKPVYAQLNVWLRIILIIPTKCTYNLQIYDYVIILSYVFWLGSPSSGRYRYKWMCINAEVHCCQMCNIYKSKIL